MEKLLAGVGLDDMKLARLRLMLRLAQARLDCAWRWGNVGDADLLVCAAGAADVHMTVLQARGRGVRCVMLGGLSDDDCLPADFDVDDIVTLLNTPPLPSGRPVKPLVLLDPSSPEVFQASSRSQPPEPKSPRDRDVDELFRRDPTDMSVQYIVPYELTNDIGLEEMAPTAFASHDHASVNFAADARVPVPPAQDPRRQAWPQPPAQPRVPKGALRLRDSLDGHLSAPCVMQLPGQAALVIDPKMGCYHIEGGLPAAEAYVMQALPVDGWRSLTGSELQQWRARVPARSCNQLLWLDALRHGDGWLPRHLDPGGSYRLREWLELDAHFATQSRISHALLQWRRLHEVAAESRASMQEVFDTVAAYEAIDCVEWVPRERLRTP